MKKDNSSSTTTKISVIIPCFNEEENIKRFEKELFSVLKTLNQNYVYEVIAIDDGSNKDNSWKELSKLANAYPFFTALRHSKNYGMGAAYQTGFDHATGEYIILFSSDLEIKPKNILNVIQALESEHDFVNTNRINRWKDGGRPSGFLRSIPSKIANKLITKISGVEIKDTGSGLKGFKRFIIENLRIYGDMHRFLPAYASLYTNKFYEIDVDYQSRLYGESTYGSIFRTLSVFLDLFSMKFMLSFSTKPFSMMPGRLFGSTGIIAFSAGSLITLYMLFVRLINQQPIGDRPLFIGGLILIVFGVQLIMLGLLGELLLRIYFEARDKTPYIVSERA